MEKEERRVVAILGSVYLFGVIVGGLAMRSHMGNRHYRLGYSDGYKDGSADIFNKLVSVVESGCCDKVKII